MKAKKTKKSARKDVLEIIIAIAIAFAFYYLLSAVTGTGMPIVSVVSESMYHEQQFDQWWEQSGKFYQDLGTEKDEFLTYQNPNGLSVGDLLFVVAGEIERGDIIIYQSPNSPITIVHRVIEIDGNTITTKGDNNQGADQPIERNRIHGKVVAAVPLLGYPRLLLHWVGV